MWDPPTLATDIEGKVRGILVQVWKGAYSCRWLRLPGFLDN